MQCYERVGNRTPIERLTSSHFSNGVSRWGCLKNKGIQINLKINPVLARKFIWLVEGRLIELGAYSNGGAHIPYGNCCKFSGTYLR